MGLQVAVNGRARSREAKFLDSYPSVLPKYFSPPAPLGPPGQLFPKQFVLLALSCQVLQAATVGLTWVGLES